MPRLLESELDEDPYATPAQRSAAAARSTWVSVAVNLVMSSLQIAVGIWAKSQGLIADGLHSLSDLVADFVVLGANKESAKAADERHPYGHHRVETAASLVLGVLLLMVGAAMMWAAVGKLQNPGAIEQVNPIALWIAAAALVAKESLFRYMLRVAKSVKSSLLVANAWHARSDAASSLVVGIGIAGNLLGFPILDPLAALIVGFMICKVGAEFAWDALHQLIDRAASDAEVAEIRATILSTPGVIDVHDLKTRQMADMIVADAHIVVSSHISVREGHDIVVAARKKVMQRHRVLNLMTHVDPADSPDGDHDAITLVRHQ